jgi:hypothetical protein
MSLTGKLIQFDARTLAVEYQATIYNEPKVIRNVWPLGYYRFRGMSAISIEDAIGREATIQDGRVSVYCGNGNYLDGGLVDGGQTKSIKTETIDVPRPKCRVETRWRDGRWEKLMRKGWVAA